MNSITMLPATDDEIRSWLQGELQAALQGGGLEWLEQPIELAVEEALEQPEAPAADEAEALAGVRRHLERASRAAAEGAWREVADTLHWLETALYWILPGAPGSRARALQDQLEAVDSGVQAAMLEPWDPDWNMWRGPEYCELLLQQPYYEGLREALEAWQRGAELTLEGGRLQIIEAED